MALNYAFGKASRNMRKMFNLSSSIRRIYYLLPTWLRALVKRFLPILEVISSEVRVSGRGARIVISNLEEAFESQDFITLGHLHHYIFSAKNCEKSYVLDDGCGTGYGSYYLATHGAKHVIGVDISKNAITHASRYFKASNLEFHVMDSLDLKFKDNQFDVVISFDVLEHVSDQAKFVAEALRVLKSGGILIIGTPNTLLSKDVNPHHVRELSPEDLSRLLHLYFREIKFLGQDLVVLGRRMKENWGVFAKKKLSLNNFIIVEDGIEHAFGLVAICRKPEV